MFRSLVFSKRSFAADALGMGFLRMEGREGVWTDRAWPRSSLLPADVSNSDGIYGEVGEVVKSW